MAVSLRFQSTGVVPGNARPLTMLGPSMTIGRGEDNDVVLPDPDKLISKRHCVIEEQGGGVTVVDLSTNGTFLNYGKVALGRVPTPLNDGDILTMGPYELLVQISIGRAAEAISAPLDDGPVSHGVAGRGLVGMDLLDDPDPGGGGVDFLDDLLGGGPLAGPSGVQRPGLGDDGLLPPLGADDAGGLLAPLPDPDAGLGASDPAHSPGFQDHFQPPAPRAGAIPDDWDLDLPGGAQDDPFASPAVPFAPPPVASVFIPDDLTDIGPVEDPVEAATPLVVDPPAVAYSGSVSPAHDHVAAASPFTTVPPVAPPVGPPAAIPAAAADAAARQFLTALGADQMPISDAELGPVMTRLGGVLRSMIHGLREVLMTRTSIKSEFRIQQTMISAGGNNPLKFSISPEQAVDAMVKPTTRGYLDPQQATDQALQDIKAHEIAMMTGMEAALKGILKRLDPAVLEGKIETSSGLGSLLKGKKARYWEVYEKMYAEISDQAENDFHDLFAKEFARAYQAQLERLK
ncbi:MAG: type VI secretion system-associated FHA domain protein TagH [Gemmobacter sp.]|nr:type VI secretion system-associated FHA domain protein TagH [Gemmobacter sp.]